MEKGLLPENLHTYTHTRNNEGVVTNRGAGQENRVSTHDSGKHAAQGPHVQRVIVVLEVHKELGALEVPGSDTNVVLTA